jgi:putative hemolysin
VAVRKTRVEELTAHKVKGARAVAAALEHLNRTIAATQLGVTLSSLGLGWVAESILAQAMAEWCAGLPAPWAFMTRHSVAGVLAFVLVTFFHVVLGELFPKTLALQAPDRIALWVARPLNIFITLTRPFTILMTAAGNVLVRLFGFHVAADGLVHSVEELALLVEDTEEAGILDPDQAELVQNVFRLTKKSVADCMVPRDKMAALELTAPSEKVLEAVRSGAHTRMPVYSGELDNIVGIVNTKNLFFLLSLRGVVVLEDAIYPPLFLKPDEEIANGLRLFKKAKRPMALVRAEGGKILGLITLEDILEEIIGDIEDEHDRPMPKETRLERLRFFKRKVMAPRKK